MTNKTVFAMAIVMGMAACDVHRDMQDEASVSSELEDACRAYTEIYADCMVEAYDDPTISAAAVNLVEDCQGYRGVTGPPADDAVELFNCYADALIGADCSSEAAYYDALLNVAASCYGELPI